MGNVGGIFCLPLLQAIMGLFDGKGVDAPGVAPGLWWASGGGDIEGRGKAATIMMRECEAEKISFRRSSI
jgi:hypothetical protein